MSLLATPLNTLEVGQLMHWEGVIERHLRGFVEVGGALAEIRDLRLYRNDFPTFEAYVEKRWGISRRRGYQLIDAAEVATNVKLITHLPQPANEAQARALGKADPEDRQAVWEEASQRSGGAPTARHVEEVIADRRGEGEDDEPDFYGLGNEADRAAAFSASPRKVPEPSPPAPFRGPKITSLSNEWYTPARYVEAAREVMGGIDLDPATCERAQLVVQAGAFYTIEHDGLSLPWFGRVWMNPPYGVDDDRNSNALRWCGRLIELHRAGVVEQATVCVNALTYAPWFQQLWGFTICFTDHRIQFGQPAEVEEKKAPVNGTAFVYLGPNVEKFAQKYAQFGAIVKRIEVAPCA